MATFNDIEYRISHGKQPRGKGQWAFSTKRKCEPEDTFFSFGTLTAAKKEAAKHFTGATTIYILG